MKDNLIKEIFKILLLIGLIFFICFIWGIIQPEPEPEPEPTAIGITYQSNIPGILTVAESKTDTLPYPLPDKLERNAFSR